MIERFLGCIQYRRVSTYKADQLRASFVLPAFVVVVLAPLFFFIPSSSHAAVLIQRPLYVGLTAGLVGNWTFDGPTVSGTSVADTSSNGNHGTMTNGPKVTAGKIGQALEFDGVNDYVDVGDQTAIDITGNISVSAWIYPHVVSTNQRIVSKWGNTGSETQYVLSTDDGSSNKLSFAVDAGTPLEVCDSLDSVGTYNANEWVLVTATYNGTDCFLYLNGVDVTDRVSNNSGNIENSATSLRIGVEGDDGTSHPFDGLIDDVRIYNRALSPQEIKRLYTIGAGSKVASVPMSEGLAGYWDFDRINGTTVYDRSDNLNHGTMTNMDPLEDQVNSKAGLGQALDFDGVNDVIQTTLNPDTIGQTAPSGNRHHFSIALWFKRTSTDTNDILISAKPSGAAIGLMVVSSGITFHPSDAPNQPFTFGWTPDQEWHHVAAVYGERAVDTPIVYLDGEPLEIVADEGAANPTTSNFVLGGRIQQTATWRGLIDDVRIYNRALTSNEVARLYNITQPTIASVSIDDGLVGYWSFDRLNGSTVPDLSSNSNHGTMTNMEPLEDKVNSKAGLGQALKFDGVNDYVDFGSIIADHFGFGYTGGVTATAWIYPTSLPSFTAVFDGNGRSLSLFIDDGVSNFYGLGDVQASYTPSTSWSLNEWQHVVFMSDGSIGSIYRNGVPIATGLSVGTNYQNVQWSIAGNLSGGGNDFPGLIDEVRIYNRALSETEIRRLYNEGNMH